MLVLNYMGHAGDTRQAGIYGDTGQEIRRETPNDEEASVANGITGTDIAKGEDTEQNSQRQNPEALVVK